MVLRGRGHAAHLDRMRRQMAGGFLTANGQPPTTAVAASSPAAAASDSKTSAADPKPAATSKTATPAASSIDSSATKAVGGGAPPPAETSSSKVVASSESKPAAATSAAATTPKAETAAAATKATSSEKASSAVHATSSAPSSSTGVRTITPSTARALSTSASASASAAAASPSSSSGVSGGTIAGIVIGLIAGIIVIGGVAGWLYKKYKDRNYGNTGSSWTKMDNDDVTPYRDPKYNRSDDELFGTPPPQNMHNNNYGTYEQAMHPDSMSMDNGNYAGYGAAAGMAGAGATGVRGSPFSDPPHIAASYDPNGRPYTPSHDQYGYDQHQQFPNQQQFHGDQQFNQFNGHGQQANPFNDGMGSPHSSLHSPNSPQNQQNFGTRQLVGPGQHYPGVGVAAGVGAGVGAGVAAAALAPVPLGRPQPPQSYDDIASAEMYADDRYADDYMAAPPQHPHAQSLNSPESFRTAEPLRDFDDRAGSAMSQAAPLSAASSSPVPAPQPLPTMAPMSPLMNELSLNDDDVQAHHLPSAAVAAAAANATPYDDNTNQMYAEVARTAGIPDPGPNAARSLSPGYQQELQEQEQDAYVTPTMPYQHGMPLSPLREMPTPASTIVQLQPERESEAQISHAQVIQRIPVPTAAPVIMQQGSTPPRPLPAIPQQAATTSQSTDSAPAPVSTQPQLPPARPESVGADDAYGGI